MYVRKTMLLASTPLKEKPPLNCANSTISMFGENPLPIKIKIKEQI